MWQVAIETMTETDIPSVRVIDQLCFLGEWSEAIYRQELRRETSYYAVARLTASPCATSRYLVGYGGIDILLDEGHLTILGVHPDYRRRGIGTILLHSLIGKACEKGATSVTLEVRQSNIAAQQFYRRHGFRVAGFRPRYYHNAEDAILMTLDGALRERFVREPHRR